VLETWHSAKNFNFFLFALNFFCRPTIVLGAKFSNLVYFYVFLLYLLNLFHLLEFFRKKQVWTACAWNNRI
jgi:hypothetical protein